MSSAPAPVNGPMSAPVHMVALGALSDTDIAARNDKRVFLGSVTLVFVAVFVVVSALIF